MKRKSKKIKRFVNGGYNPQQLKLGAFGQTDTYSKLVNPQIQQLQQQINSPLQSPLSGNGGSGISNIAGGINKAANIAQGLGSMINMVSGESTATTKGEAVSQSIQNVVGGAATGAKMGSAFGPVGAIVGGVAGLGVGLVGKKGKVTEQGFYEDPTMTLGTGIRGARQNKELRREYERLKVKAANHRIGAQTGSLVDQEIAETYDQDVQTMAYGGQIPTSLAYVDDGELISTPDGNMLEVPEKGRPTDSNLVDLPEGSRILSDTLKVPGTKETFAQMGKRMMSKKKSKAKDIYAQNAEKLNKMNDQIIHDKLFSIQEGIKKVKGNTSKFKDGGSVITANNKGKLVQIADRLYRPFNYWEDVYDKQLYSPEQTQSANKQINTSSTTKVPTNTQSLGYKPSTLNEMVSSADKAVNTGEWRGGTPYWLLSSTGYSAPAATKSNTNVNTPTTRSINKKRSTTAATKSTDSGLPLLNNELDLSSESVDRLSNDEYIPVSATRSVTGSNIEPINTYKQTPGSIDWLGAIGDVTSNVAQLAPVFSNLNAKSESFDSVHNPYSQAIMKQMAGRRYDISPAERAIRENRAVSNYNAAQYNPTTGANMAYRLQSQIAANKAISDLYSYKNNADNQYRAEYANTMNNLGQQFAQARNLAIDYNARSRATARNIKRAGLAQLSQFAQNKELMRNQKSRDMAMLDLYGPFLEAGYDSKTLNKVLSQFRKK